jgi:hypothetical protein
MGIKEDNQELRIPSEEAARAWASPGSANRGNTDIPSQHEYEASQRGEAILNDAATAPTDQEWPIETSDGEGVLVASPETKPDLYIQVRRPELVPFDGFEVLSGRTIVSYRLRRPEDGDARFVTEPARPKTPLVDPRLPEETYNGWRNRVIREGGQGHTAIRVGMGYPSITPQRDSGAHWRHRRNSRFAGWGE